MELKYTCSRCGDQTAIDILDFLTSHLMKEHSVRCTYCGKEHEITLRLTKVEPINNGEYDYE